MNLKRIALIVVSLLIFLACLAHYIKLRESARAERPFHPTATVSSMPSPEPSSIPPVVPPQNPPSEKTEVSSAPAADGLPEGVHLALKKGEKVLRSSVEETQFQAALKNPEMISATANRLLDSTASEETRMKAITFLDLALSLKENPSRPLILSEVQRVLSDRSIEGIQDAELKKSLAADRVELFVQFLKSDREKAVEFKKQFEGTQIGRLMTFAQNFYFSQPKKGG